MTFMREERTFNGRTYYRYPQSENPSDRKYFRTHGWGGRPNFLHRDVWERHRSTIPPGHHIHHIDGDTGNNDLTNLECIDAAAHWAHHDEINRQSHQWWEDSRARMDHARKFASEWHGSEEGRAWHSEHGKNTWEDREPKAATCEHCGNAYKSHFPRGFCSNKCKAAARRASGVDDVERTCTMCGSTFIINKYSKSVTCSRKCGSQMAGHAQRGKPRAPRSTRNLTCQWCGQPFTGLGGTKYCRDDCRKDAARARRKKK